MHYMARHGVRRARPGDIKPGTVRVISVRLDYWPAEAAPAEAVLADPASAYVSRYALGRDYHKIMRNALQTLADRIEARIGPFGYRVFVDSGPVLEKPPLARDAGLGWVGKHTNLIAREAGSWFFLGEIFTDLPLPADGATGSHCGSCEACLPACPTGAITAPWQLDARRCISYLTIELQGSIPEEMRAAIGNRVFGCDDCQLVCPWNRFAQPSRERDFVPRHGLDDTALVDLFSWNEEEFATRAAGSPLYRLGHARWLRNIAVALGNGPPTDAALEALAARLQHPGELVREHARWAWEQLQERRKNAPR
jgi:epoxyqueuosine reductase